MELPPSWRDCDASSKMLPAAGVTNISMHNIVNDTHRRGTQVGGVINHNGHYG